MISPCAIGYPVKLELTVLFQLPCRKRAFLHQAQAKQEGSAQDREKQATHLVGCFCRIRDRCRLRGSLLPAGGGR